MTDRRATVTDTLPGEEAIGGTRSAPTASDPVGRAVGVLDGVDVPPAAVPADRETGPAAPTRGRWS